jgi:hypothetical protein
VKGKAKSSVTVLKKSVANFSVPKDYTLQVYIIPCAKCGIIEHWFSDPSVSMSAVCVVLCR